MLQHYKMGILPESGEAGWESGLCDLLHLQKACCNSTKGFKGIKNILCCILKIL